MATTHITSTYPWNIWYAVNKLHLGMLCFKNLSACSYMQPNWTPGFLKKPYGGI